MVFTRDGCLRPVIIPKHDEVSAMIIQCNMRVAEMSQSRYFELLKRCKQKPRPFPGRG